MKIRVYLEKLWQSIYYKLVSKLIIKTKQFLNWSVFSPYTEIAYLYYLSKIIQLIL